MRDNAALEQERVHLWAIKSASSSTRTWRPRSTRP